MNHIEKKQMKRRKEIIEGIVPLLEETPLDELSVKEICEVAGISIGTFYHYFKQKDDLGIALMMKGDMYLEENVFPKMTNDDEIENLRIYAMGVTQQVSDLGVVRAKFVMEHFGPADFDLDGNLRQEIVKVKETIAAGQKKGQITTEYSAEELRDFLHTAVQGIGIEWTRRNGTYSLIDKMKGFLDIFLRALKKQ